MHSLVKHSLWSAMSKRPITHRRVLCSCSFTVIAVWLLRERPQHMLEQAALGMVLIRNLMRKLLAMLIVLPTGQAKSRKYLEA